MSSEARVTNIEVGLWVKLDISGAEPSLVLAVYFTC